MNIKSNICRLPLVCAALVLLTLAAFAPVFQCGFVYYDDPAYVYGNPHVNQGLSWDAVHWAFTALHASNWHPLTWLSHALDCQLFGLNPAGHHATNLLLHSANVLLLFALLRKLTGTFWRSVLVAALFALHPLHVESVAWISERKDVLSVFFGLLTLLAYARYVTVPGRARHSVRAAAGKDESKRTRQPDAPSPPRPNPSPAGAGDSLLRSGEKVAEGRMRCAPRPGEVSKHSPSPISHLPSPILHPLASRTYWFALLCFALSLLSKPMLVTLPCLLLLLDFWPLGRVSGFTLRVSDPPKRSTTAQPGTRNSELGALVLEKLPFLLLVLGSIPLTLMAQAKGGSVAPVGDISLVQRLGNSAIAAGWYVGKLFWPLDLAVIYPLFPTRNPLQVLAGSVVVVGFSIMAIWQLRRRPHVFTAWFWFLGTLVPVIGLVQVGMQRFADRYTYFSYTGLFMLVAWTLAEFATSPRRRWLITAGAVVVAALCAAGTNRQCRYWQDSETLFGRAVSVTRSNYIALNNLGFALAERKEYERAIEYYHQALAAAPRFAESFNNLGCAYLGQRKYDLAAQQFRAALGINPGDVRALNNLGTALHEAGDVTNAIAQYERALELAPDYAEAHYNLANSLAAAGQITKALAHYQRAIDAQADYPGARVNFGLELFKLGRFAEAETQFKHALASGTNHYGADFWLAAIARQKGDADAEVRHLRAFLVAEPDHARARTQLAMALAGQQQPAAALVEAREAVKRQPGFAPAHFCLGVLLEQAGQPAPAIASYEAALRLQADYPEALNNLAWLLAASADAALRDGPRAVQLARRACELTHYETPMLIGTLAAAHAEAGQFSEAVAAAEQAAKVAETAGDQDLAAKNREFMDWYRTRKTWREGAAQR